MKLATGFLALAATLLPAYEFAHAGIVDVKRSVEASMVVTGTIEVNPDGSVHGYSLDAKDKIPPEIVQLVDQTVTPWKFKPVLVDGKPVLAKAVMALRIVAEQAQPKQFEISVHETSFGNAAATALHSCQPGACLVYADDNDKPTFPEDMVRAGASSRVYVTVKIDREGRVEQAMVRQVNLRALADATTLEYCRQRFARASLKAVREWRFKVPTVGEDADQDYWLATVPIDYYISGRGRSPAKYGEWDSYVPGPVQPLPPEMTKGGDPSYVDSGNAVPTGTVPFVHDPRFVLLTPLVPGKAQQKPEAGQG